MLSDDLDSEVLIERLRAGPWSCFTCGAPVGGHEYLVGYVLGLADEPRCIQHLAEQAQQPAVSLLEAVIGHISRRDCLRRAWTWVGVEAGLAEDEILRPPSLFRAAATAGAPAVTSTHHETKLAKQRPVAPSEVAERWDAGELSCGDLVLELRMRLRALQPGQIIEVCSRDLAAPQDLPAWCRLTGHTLVSDEHPVYFIQRKQE
ncbi:MAG: sulfurtransferase TusA family protein [Myxococcales bacterium FL481]|nr:MAG: sulfurtransferase TusA family protein [Myxococcales bacterium FL481]